MGGLGRGAKCLKLLGSKVGFLGALMGFFREFQVAWISRSRKNSGMILSFENHGNFKRTRSQHQQVMKFLLPSCLFH